MAVHSATLMWLPVQDFDQNKCGGRENDHNEIWTLNKRQNLSSWTKLALSAGYTHCLKDGSVG